MGTSATVTVLAFGSAAGVLGWPTRELPLPPAATLAEIIATLERECPRLAEGRGRLRFAVNQLYATPATPLHAGDEIAIIPPVSGGDSQADAAAPARLTRAPIDLAALVGEVEAAAVGAIATFVGVVRAEVNGAGRSLRALEYSAYEPMALAEMLKLAEAAGADRALHAVRLVHRLGELSIGEASVAVVVSAPHRGEAFDACRSVIEALKASVPIFKRELWQGGETSWVEPNAQQA